MTTLLLPQPRIKTWDDACLHTICALAKRAERDRTQTFFAEGLRFVGQAVASSADIVAVLVVPKTLEHPFGLKLRRQLEQKHVPIWEITPELFPRLSRAEEPQWIGAVIRQRWGTPVSATSSPGLCWVALDQMHSPGNLGTIPRTSATMGAVFAQQFVRMAPAVFAAWKQHTSIYLVGTSPHARRDYRAAAYPPGTVLLMGGERKGLSRERQGLCDELVRIPMVGQADSLNLAVATGVMLYEVFGQRRNSG
jgi:TrmH family RNA methyltransferase